MSAHDTTRAMIASARAADRDYAAHADSDMTPECTDRCYGEPCVHRAARPEPIGDGLPEPVTGTADVGDPGEHAAAAALALADRLYSTGRRDTPTATVIGRLDPLEDRHTWLSLRRTGIGSSDMAAVLGMDGGSYARSELDVWADKVGEVPLDADGAGEAALWGNLLEDPVAREWARRRGVTVQRIGTLAHVDRRHLICDLDRRVIGCTEHDRCALEVKTRSAYTADQWKDGALPEKIEAQAMHQLAVTGYDAVHVAALIGGQRMVERLVVPDAAYIGDLFTVADAFWTDNVLTMVPPAISSLDLLVDHLSRLAPTKGEPVHVDETTALEVKHLSRIVRDAKAAEDARGHAEKELKRLIGEDGTDLLDPAGEVWWTWRPQAKAKRLDLDAVAVALGLADADEVKATYSVSDGTNRVLRQGPAAKRLMAEGDA